MAQVLAKLVDELQGLDIIRSTSVSGRVSRFDGHIIECDGFPATIGTLCEIDTQDGNRVNAEVIGQSCLLYTSPSPRDLSTSRMPSSA